MRPPELRRVADLLGDRPSLLERAPRVLPAPRRAGGLAREAPRLDQILARVRAGGEVQAPARVARGRVEITPRQRQLTLARGEPDRVAEAHPGAGGGIAGEAVDAIEHLAREPQIAPGQEDVAEVQLSVGQGARVLAAAAFVGAATIPLGRAVEVAQLEVQPPQAVEQSMMDRLVADLPRELEALAKRRERGRIVALAGQGEPAQEGAEEQRQQQIVLARDLEPALL